MARDGIDLMTFTYLDVLQPQLAGFLATVSQGYLPLEEQASLYLEIAPGLAINRLTDIALKKTGVTPGMQIVERAFGVLEVHSDDTGEVRAAGEAILDYLQVDERERHQPQVLTTQIITGIEGYHAQLVNRMRHGDMIPRGDTLYILEVKPAGYALFAANEAEKHSPIHVLEVRAFGATGRVHLGGSEAAIGEAAGAVTRALESIQGRAPEKKKR